MVIKQLEQETYERLCAALLANAHCAPLDPSYTVTLLVDNAEYAVKLQPEKDHQMAVLQALRVYREPDGPHFALLTEPDELSALLDVLIRQGVHSRRYQTV